MARARRRAPPRRPRRAAAGGRQVRFQGLGTRCVVGAEQTGGVFAIVEHDLAPRVLGAPMHTHEREEEISHVTAGRLGVQIGDEVLEAARATPWSSRAGSRTHSGTRVTSPSASSS